MNREQSKKFKVQEGQKILVLNSPSDFKFEEELKINRIQKYQKGIDAIYLFVKNSKELEKNFPKLVSYLTDENFLWLFYPKSSSKIKSDINRDSIMKFSKKFPVKISTLVSYNEVWAAFLIRKIKPQDLRKESLDQKRFLPFIDFKKRIVLPPEDFLQALKKNKIALERFNKLSFSHKKEYVQSILEAKRVETRLKRIEKAIKMLSE